MVFYADTSALVKLVVAEPETRRLRSWISQTSPTLVSSDLTRTELLRAARRTAPDQIVQARAVLDSLILITPSPATFEAAAFLDPAILRSLDALHLATALELGDDLDGFVCYNQRLAEAAKAHGMTVVAPD
ncbi:type II toxin-antitoxin system VapC family toxin [Brooklawnia sp.]|uniref:type II toxin-antitoxin system VapC family toxin n=1 Tax=Brooklawnia sp. TaxID=2699740 RepID=UPI00311D65A8